MSNLPPRRAMFLLTLPIFALLVTPAIGEKLEEQEARIERIEDAVLAPCCYTEPVSRHQSEVAVKMRLEIAKWVAAGKTDQEILDAYVKQYGSKVLVDPRTLPRLWMQWVPWFVLVLGVAVAVWLLHRWHSRPVPSATPTNNDSIELPGLDDDSWT